MPPDIIKIVGPIFFLIFYAIFSYKNRTLNIAGSLFYIACFVAMSSNFSFIYRQIFQVTQAMLIFFTVLYVIKNMNIHVINKTLFFISFFILISLVFSTLDSDSKSQTLNFVSIIGVLNFLLIQLKTYSQMKVFLNFTASLAFIAACLGLIEYSFFSNERIEATFSNPNYYSFFLGIGFCISAANKTNKFYWAKLIIIFAVIVLTGSRAGLAYPLFMLAWFTYKSSKDLNTLALALVSLLFIGFLFFSNFTRLSDTQNTSGSDAERLIFTRIAFDMAKDHPLTGVGWGRFPSEFSNYATSAEIVFTTHGEIIDVSGQDRRVTHNDLSRIMAELGFFALGLFLLLSVKLSFIGIRLSIDEHIYLFPAWLGTCLFSLTHNNLNNLLFWFVFLLPLILLNMGLTQPRQSQQ